MMSVRSSRFGAIHEWAGKVTIVAFYLPLVQRILADVVATGRITGLILLAVTSMSVAFTLARRSAGDVDRSWEARAVTIAAVGGPLLFDRWVSVLHPIPIRGCSVCRHSHHARRPVCHPAKFWACTRQPRHSPVGMLSRCPTSDLCGLPVLSRSVRAGVLCSLESRRMDVERHRLARPTGIRGAAPPSRSCICELHGARAVASCARGVLTRG
jgi:hypothetical protein